MEAKVEQTPVTNVNPVLSVDKNGCVLYSNEAGNLLLKDWGMTIGEKVPSHIGDIVQRVISLNSPEKIEVKAGSKAYFVVFSPLPEHEYVNISGFDISDQKELEEKLWESEARFSAFMDNNPANAWMKNEQGEYIFLNKTSLDKIGIWHENWLGKTDHEIFPQDIAGLLCENDREVLTSNKTIAVEEETVNPDGRCIHWLGFKFPFKDASGKRYVGGIAVDITQRKQAEEALKKLSGTLEEKVKERTAELEKAYNSLKESEKRLAEAQRMAHIGDWEWDIKTDSAYWSDEMYRIFERDPLKLAPPYNEFLNYLHSDDREYAYNAHKEALNAETFSMDHRIILPNGKERTIHMKTEVIFNENSIPIRLKGTVQDITERKEVEEKLRESEEKYRNIVETANEGIGLIDNELKLTYVNKKIEEMIGYSSEEIIGKSIWDFISEDSKPIVKSILDRGLRDFENPELKYIRKDGSHFWAQVNAKPIFDIDGKFMGILTMIADITKRKEAEETLTNFENARKKEIHHRIKNKALR